MVDGLAKGGGGGGDSEDATTGGEEMVFDHRGAGLEDLGTGGLGGLDAGDGISGANLGGISVGGEYDAERRIEAPLEGGVLKISGGGEREDVGKVGLEGYHEGLSFGVAETDVVFEDFGAGGGHHQSSEEKAREGDSFGIHAVDGGAEYFPEDLFVLGRSEDSVIDVGTHATRVGPEVAVEDGFMVLGGF